MGELKPNQMARLGNSMSRRNGLVWCPQQYLKQSYLFVSLSEVGSVYFIHSHDYGYHVLPIHDGGSQDVLGLILREFIHKVTEMLILREGRDKQMATRTGEHLRAPAVHLFPFGKGRTT